jgi:ATP-dependent helicase YprA (DUF1998 family)
VTECPCPYHRGCPACVQHLDCKNYVSWLSISVFKAHMQAVCGAAPTSSVLGFPRHHDCLWV